MKPDCFFVVKQMTTNEFWGTEGNKIMRRALSIATWMLQKPTPDVTAKTALAANTCKNSDSVNIVRVFFVVIFIVNRWS